MIMLKTMLFVLWICLMSSGLMTATGRQLGLDTRELAHHRCLFSLRLFFILLWINIVTHCQSHV